MIILGPTRHEKRSRRSHDYRQAPVVESPERRMAASTLVAEHSDHACRNTSGAYDDMKAHHGQEDRVSRRNGYAEHNSCATGHPSPIQVVRLASIPTHVILALTGSAPIAASSRRVIARSRRAPGAPQERAGCGRGGRLRHAQACPRKTSHHSDRLLEPADASCDRYVRDLAGSLAPNRCPRAAVRSARARRPLVSRPSHL
jgi:hypothetical protein